MHENLERADDVRRFSDRAFGLVLAAVLVLVALSPLLSAPPVTIRWWALAAALLLGILALVWTTPLRPLAHLWFMLGLLLGRIINPIVLALLYYAIVLPVGLLVRLFGHNAVAKRRDPAAASYWIEREIPRPAVTAMKDQF